MSEEDFKTKLEELYNSFPDLVPRMTKGAFAWITLHYKKVRSEMGDSWDSTMALNYFTSLKLTLEDQRNL